jgi:hypothetical protein
MVITYHIRHIMLATDSVVKWNTSLFLHVARGLQIADRRPRSFPLNWYENTFP